jgi:hypothetical protein
VTIEARFRVLLDPGVLPTATLMRLRALGGKELGFIVESERFRQMQERLGSDIDLVEYPNASGSMAQVSIAAAAGKWSRIVDDHQTFLLLDRCDEPFASHAMAVAHVLCLCVHAEEMIRTLRPQVYVTMAIPHNINTWVFARVAESIGVRVMYFQHSPLPWRYFLLEGLSRTPQVIVPSTNSITIADQRLWQTYLQRKRGSPSDAMPYYEKERIDRNSGVGFNLLREVQDCWRTPSWIWNKWKCWRAYCRYAIQIPDQRFVVLFLNWQPEATSLPAGFGYAQQLAAVISIVAALPEGVRLLVREHPSTFTNMADPRQRNPWWYEQIISVQNVQLVSMEIDPYTLIDQALATITITGTVAFESVIRGSPAVVMGCGPLSHIPLNGVHRFENISALRQFLQRCCLQRPTSLELEEYAIEILKVTFSGIGADHSSDLLDGNDDHVRFSAIERGLEQLVNTVPPQ